MPLSRRETRKPGARAARGGDRPWILGTRASPLARAQAEEARDALIRALRRLGFGEAVEIRALSTAGDRIRDVPLRDIGGKALFVSDIHRALAAGDIDFAAHSAKDLPGELPPGVRVAAALPRRDPADALVSRRAGGLDGLPPGAVVGTCSPRREAQLRFRRPDLRIAPLRGNVGTRLAAVGAPKGPDATLLAVAGLDRLGLGGESARRLDPAEWLPAVGQGILAITARDDDADALEVAHRAADGSATLCLAAERGMLAGLGGDCFTPIAGLAEAGDGTLLLRGEILSVGGEHCVEAAIEGGADDAEQLGRTLAADLLDLAGADFWRRGSP